MTSRTRLNVRKENGMLGDGAPLNRTPPTETGRIVDPISVTGIVHWSDI